LNLDILSLEYEVQMFILRIFSQMMFFEKSYVNTFGDLGLYEKMVHVGLWISFIFSQDEKVEGILEKLKENTIDLLSHEKSTKSSKSYFMSSFMNNKRFTENHHIYDKSGYIKKVPNEKFIYFFDSLSEISSYSSYMKSNEKFDPSLNKKIINNETLCDVENIYQLECICLLTKLFIEKNNEPQYVIEARSKLKLFFSF
jgi:hypothetical protein